MERKDILFMKLNNNSNFLIKCCLPVDVAPISTPCPQQSSSQSTMSIFIKRDSMLITIESKCTHIFMEKNR